MAVTVYSNAGVVAVRARAVSCGFGELTPLGSVHGIGTCGSADRRIAAFAASRACPEWSLLA